MLAVLAAGACGSEMVEPTPTPDPAPAPDPTPDPTPEPPPSPSLAASVVELSPSAHHTFVSIATRITIEFDTPLDPSSITPAEFRVFGRWSGVATGTFTLEAGGARIRFAPDADFAAGEFVTVTLAGSIRLADGTPLGRGFAWSFWTAAGVGSLDQVNIGTRTVRRPGEGLIQAYGAYAGDIDGDGDSDLIIPNEVANDIRVFLNQDGDYGPFTVYPIPGGSRPSTNEGEDFDGDGLIDFATGNSAGDEVSVFRGVGDGTFNFTGGFQADTQVRGLCLLDFDGDGDQDIVTANRMGVGSGSVTLLRNLGGTFVPAGTLDAGGSGETSCASADVNGDGVIDLVVGNISSLTVSVLLGDGAGGFSVDGVFLAGGGPWMLVAGDLNGDGHVDVVSANASADNVGILLGTGDGQLLPVRTFSTGSFPLAVDLGDLDGDGDLDVVVSNFETVDWTVFENDGAGQLFNARTLDALGAGSCAILHDRDGDGDLDITGVDELEDRLFLFRNEG